MEKSWNCVFEFLWEPWITFVNSLDQDQARRNVVGPDLIFNGPDLNPNSLTL